MNQITFQQYRNIDLTIWVVLTVIFEAITTLATGKWFYAQPIAISITLAMVCITMMRWGGHAAWIAVAGGFVFSFASGAAAPQYLIYCIGNLFALSGLLVLKGWGKEKVRESRVRIFVFVTVSYLGMAIGRWLVSLVYGGTVAELLAFVTTDVITLLFAVITVCLMRKSDGMIEDQKAYLLRLEAERAAEAQMPVPEEDEF